jgi:glycosyltransferase involved in cell wall biosynthesis
LARILRQEEIQLVDVHLSRDLWTVVPAVRFVPGVKIILHKHVGSRKSKADPIHRWLYSGVDRVLAVSEAIRHNVMESCDLPAAKVDTLHWGLELEKFVAHPGAGLKVRQEFGLSSDIPLVGMVGRLTPRKGHREFLLAARAVNQAMPHARFLVVGRHSHGEVPFERQIVDLCAQLGLDDRVIFTGHREDIPQVMAALDLLVVPSYWEAFGWVTMEAMAMAKPVVATAGGGTLDIVIHGKTGLLVPPRDAEKLGQAILVLLRDKVMGERMGRAGRRRVEGRFTIERTVDRQETIMEELMAETENGQGSDLRLSQEEC